MKPPPSRIQAARLRAESAKLGLAVVMVALFISLLVLVRLSHPAKASSAGVVRQTGQSSSSSTGGGTFSQGSVSEPSQAAAPTISSAGS
jgi:hypothetical protein